MAILSRLGWSTASLRHLYGSAWLAALLLCLTAAARAAGPATGIVKAEAPAEAYVIQLAATDELPRPDSFPSAVPLQQYRLYALPAERGKPFAYRLRLGFFTDRKEAQTVKDQLMQYFPASWILKVSPLQEQRDGIALALNAAAAPPTGGPATTPAPATDDRLATLMESGRQAVATGDYPLAIRIYTKVLDTPDNPYARDALEYLGLARDRNGQAAHAKAEYDQYLVLYPEGPGAERIRQRLAGLLTAREEPREKLPEQKITSDKPMEWSSAGSLSQYYRRDVTTIDGAGQTVNQSALVTDLDLSARGRSENVDVRARFNGGYTYDLQSDGENLSRISNLYIDASNRRSGLSGRLGRQTRSSGGVFGRFDGLLVGYQTERWGKFNVVGGYPVERSSDISLNHEQVFYGISADLPPWMERWDYSVYAISQQAGDLTDRRAVGGEARYLDDARSLLALLDYDLHFRELNIFSLIGNWTVDEWTAYNFGFNQSRSPFLSTTNALIGQTVTQMEDLLDTYSENVILDLALNRTATSRALSGGITRTLNDRLQLNADITLSSLSGTPASAGIAATESTGNEYLYSFQLVGNSLVRQGDLSILGLIYADASTTNTVSLHLNSRFPVTDLLRINPRLRFDYRQFDQDEGTQLITTPSIRFDYRYRRNIDLDADIGMQWSNRDTSGTSEKTSGYYLFIGYSLGF